MSPLLISAAVILVSVALVTVFTAAKRERPSAQNNWRNEDFMAREADGSWTEGSLYSKSLPGDSTGIGVS